MKLSNILIKAKATLSKANIEEPLRESKLLICHALSCSLEIFLLDSEKEIPLLVKEKIGDDQSCWNNVFPSLRHFLNVCCCDVRYRASS